jgi:hypothetical protein
LSTTSDSGNTYIKGGTIYGLASASSYGAGIYGVYICQAASTAYIGVDDSSITTTDPEIMGCTNGLYKNSSAKVYWYDGTIYSVRNNSYYVNTTSNLNYSSSYVLTGKALNYTYNSTSYYGYGYSLKSRY